MKKILLLFMITTLLFSYTININKGWQLKGALENLEVNSTFNKSEIISIWYYKNNKWQAYFNDSEIMNKIKNKEYENIELLQNIKKGEGFWINSNKSLSIETLFIDYNIKGKIPDKTLNITQAQTKEDLRAYIWLPQNYSKNQKYPTIIMAHGCGGAHYTDEPQYWNKNYIAGKYKMWGELLSKNGFIVLLVDSFTTRDNNDVGKGVCESNDALNRPEKIDPISIRPGDIASGIAYMKSRNDVDKTKIGVLGFSNGGTSALVFANHTSLIEREEELKENNKTAFHLPLDDKYKANVIITLYPGCGLNGYSLKTQHIFDNKFKTDTKTYIFMAYNDHILPADTKEKCYSLKELDNSLIVKEVPNTDHQFDYYERNETSVQKSILEIIKILRTM